MQPYEGLKYGSRDSNIGHNEIKNNLQNLIFTFYFINVRHCYLTANIIVEQCGLLMKKHVDPQECNVSKNVN